MTSKANKQGWRQVKLKDVCREITVGYVGPMVNEYVDEGIPFLRSQNIQPFSLDLASIKYISAEFNNKLKKSALRPGDLAVVRTGYPGTACVIPKEFPESNCADLVIIRPSEDIDGHYLSCVFNSTWGKGHVAGNLVGVAQQHFNVGAAKEMSIFLPPISEQLKIASILSAYDDLIENNTRRIKILEEMARMIYREWFVNFRFPGHDGRDVPVARLNAETPRRGVSTKTCLVDSPLGKIPEGWEVGRLQDYVELCYGKALKAEDRLDGQYPVYGSSGVVGFHSEHLVDSPGVIVGRKGNVGSVRWTDEPFFPIDTVYYVKTDVSLYYVFYNLQQQNFINNDAAVPGLNRNQAYSLPFILPSEHQLKAFDEFVGPVFKAVRSLLQKNQNLRQTRDLLLPKLISGDVVV